jgi:hypothetical protein
MVVPAAPKMIGAFDMIVTYAMMYDNVVVLVPSSKQKYMVILLFVFCWFCG